MNAVDFINWNSVSKSLTGNPDYIRKSWIGTDKVPPKYRKQISELLSTTEQWLISNTK